MYYGVNFSGAEFGVSTDGAFNSSSSTTWFPHGHYDYFKSKGFNFIRLPLAWDRLQPTLNGAFDTAYAAKLKDAVDYATSIGLTIAIDIHNYARRNGNLIGSTAVPTTAFADLWSKLATLYKANSKVIFGLCNEPHDMTTSQWLTAANAATVAIRATGATNMIFVSGNYWGGTTSWVNGEMNGYVDSLNNSTIEVHCYLNADGSGSTSDVVSTTVLRDRLTSIVNWCKTNKKKFFLGEFSTGPTDTKAKTAVQDGLTYLAANSDVCLGWSWWANIGNAPPNDQWTPYAINPSLDYKTEDAKVAWLTPFMVATTTPVDPSSSVPTNPITFTKGTSFTLTTSSSNYWVVVPNTYDSTHKTPMTLFVWLHGCGGYSQNDVYMVSPGGTTQTWISIAIGGREGGCWSDVASDGPKILAAIADMKTHFNIAPERIVLGGYSSGGDIGYPFLFQNAKLFSGGIFENTGPSSQALTQSTSAAWKLNIAHLAHLSDTVYPIATIRNNMNTLKNNGFPVSFIEKAGTHWDNDSGQTGTTYDLVNYLLPFLNAGWKNPTVSTTVPPVVVPPVVVPPVLKAVDGFTKTSTTNIVPGDQGFTATKVIGDGYVVPKGTYKLAVATRSTYGDNNMFVVNMIVENPNDGYDVAWKSMTVDLRGHTLQSSWDCNVVGTTGVITITPSSSGVILSKNKNAFGLAITRMADPAKKYYQILVKSVVF